MKRYIILSSILCSVVLHMVYPKGTLAQGPPINTETAFVVGLEGAALRTLVKTTRKSKLLKGTTKVSDPSDRQVQVVAVPIIIPYELIPNRIVVAAAIPYLHKELSLTQDGIRRALSDNGFGDLSLLFKYQLLQWDAHRKTTRITFKGGLKLPTGDHDETDELGELLRRGLQLGTGSLDYSAGLILTHSVGRLGINTDAIYTFKREADKYRFGDSLNYDLAVGYRIYPSVYETYPSPYATLYLEVNGQFKRRDEENRGTVEDSGGHILSLSPGIQYIPLSTLIIEASIQIPVLQDLNGTQLGTDFAFVSGIRWLIF